VYVQTVRRETGGDGFHDGDIITLAVLRNRLSEIIDSRESALDRQCCKVNIQASDHKDRYKLEASMTRMIIRRVIEDFWRGRDDTRAFVLDRLLHQCWHCSQNHRSQIIARRIKRSQNPMSPETRPIDSRQGEFKSGCKGVASFLAEGRVRPAAHRNGIHSPVFAVRADVVRGVRRSIAPRCGRHRHDSECSSPVFPSSDLPRRQHKVLESVPTREHFVAHSRPE